MLINVNVKWRENMLHTVVAGVSYEFDDANSISFIFTFYVCLRKNIKWQFNIHVYDQTHFRSVKLETYGIACTVAAYMWKFLCRFCLLVYFHIFICSPQ